MISPFHADDDIVLFVVNKSLIFSFILAFGQYVSVAIFGNPLRIFVVCLSVVNIDKF